MIHHESNSELIKQSVSIKGNYSEKDLKALSKYKQINSLKCTDKKLVTAKVSSGFATLQAVKSLWVWSSITRTAMRDIIRIPKLEVLDILEIKYPGQLMYFSEAMDLMEFRCNHYMAEKDLFEISKLPNLEELGAQSADVTAKSLEAILSMNKLENLDLEGSEFNDELAAIMAHSNQLIKVDIGSTNLTGKGLKLIANMTQLQSLDIWATRIDVTDLGFLTQLQNLEYLSMGDVEGHANLNYQAIKPILNEMPQLKKLWLDGVNLTDDEIKELESKYEYFRH